MSNIKLTEIRKNPANKIWDGFFSVANAEKARSFHEGIPGYENTPLACLSNLAGYLGIKGLYVKDESSRFGLNAFKGLGGSYAISKYIAGLLGKEEISFEEIISPEVREIIKDVTFVTATDGNHGRGIAWTSEKLGVKSVVYLPQGSSRERLENIKALGADASITECNYDDTVRFAKKQAGKNGWVFIQDTAWEGYEEIPANIMLGYTTLALEAFEELGDVRPTHVFLQAGVGAMSGAITGILTSCYGDDSPVITIVEPDRADCIYRTALAADGKLHNVEGDLDTMMAGLACGEPCTIGWKLISAHADFAMSVPEAAAARGMRVLGNPIGDDRRVISGESGAVTAGIVYELLTEESLLGLKKKIGLDENSVILLISTEGDTDKENYRRIVWDGHIPI